MSNLITNGRLPSLRDDLFFPFEQHFDKFFNDFFNNGKTAVQAMKASSGYPKVDIFESDEYLTLHAALPGMDAEKVNVEIFDEDVSGAYGSSKISTIVRISGIMEDVYKSNEGDNYHYRELKKTKFMREFKLPTYVETSEPETSCMKNGILTLKWKLVRKTMPKNTPKKIEVKKED